MDALQKGLLLGGCYASAACAMLYTRDHAKSSCQSLLQSNESIPLMCDGREMKLAELSQAFSVESTWVVWTVISLAILSRLLGLEL